MHRRINLVGIVVVLTMLFTVPALAAPTCFAETNQCLDGRIREYWERNGALPVFGFPISIEGPELNRDMGNTYRTQWMERNRFELHPEHQAPYDVLLGRLGDDRLRQQGRDWQTFPKADPSAPHYFAASGHAIGHEPFWVYWRDHGLELGDRQISDRESLALFGLPISEPAMETNASGDTVLTQWFERARFEYHPNNPEPYKVLLGLLGNEVRANTNPGTVPPPPTTPTPTPGTQLPPPSYNNCEEDPNAGRAPNAPVAIVAVDKSAETVTLRNVSGAAVELTGWRICSIRGNQVHATLSGSLAAGATQVVPSQAGTTIWSNSEQDDAALYNANGQIVSYRIDR